MLELTTENTKNTEIDYFYFDNCILFLSCSTVLDNGFRTRFASFVSALSIYFPHRWVVGPGFAVRSTPPLSLGVP